MLDADDIKIEMKAKDDCATDHLVGIDGQVEVIMDLLDYDVGRARCLGIHGPGGIGKTTLAKALFDKLISNFEWHCFLRDVSGSSRRDGLVFLQKKLLSGVLGKTEHGFQINDIDEGMEVIKEELHYKKVLIVLDDVDHREQLEKLIGKISCFGEGSRVIIMTRNKSILESREKIILYEPKEMDSDQALQLFKNHAFKRESPRDYYYDRLSRDVVSSIGGLPLVVEVIGSCLHWKHKTVWKDTLEKLRGVAHEEVYRKLKISYDALNIREKQIFLDIACLPFHEEETNASYMWEDCDVYPQTEIGVLSSLSLINIGKNGRLWMHHLLKDLGRQIVHLENLDPGKRSRLWIAEETMDMVKTKENKRNIEALSLAGDPTLLIFTAEDFARLPNLRFLELDGANFVGDFTNLFSNLRWFSWCHCPPDFIATNLFPQNLVVLQLSEFNDANDWEGWSQIKMLHNLKVLELTRLDLNIIDLFGCFTLERLIIKECRQLIDIARSIGELKQLAFLTIEDCHLLNYLPDEIGQLVKLRHLSLSHCSKLRKLPSLIGELKSLIKLDLSYTSIEVLPHSVGHLANLESLSLAGCREMEELLHWTGNLESLIELDLSFMWIKELPSAIGKSSCLRILDLSKSDICRVPETIAALPHLEELILKNCNKLQVLPSLPSSLTHLLVSSQSLQSIPDLSNLTNLVDLVLLNSVSMSSSSLVEAWNLEWIGNLSKLVKLELCFPNIIISPTSLDSFSRLKKLSMSGLQPPKFVMQPITTFPDLCNLRDLVILKLYHSWYREIQLGGLEKLRHLTVYNFPVLERIVFSQSQLGLKNLKELELRECSMLREIHGLGALQKLMELRIALCGNLQALEGLDELGCLTLFQVERCPSLEYWTNASDSMIPDECQIVILRCQKVGGTFCEGMRYKDYRDKYHGQIKSDMDTSTSDRKDKTISPQQDDGDEDDDMPEIVDEPWIEDEEVSLSKEDDDEKAEEKGTAEVNHQNKESMQVHSHFQTRSLALVPFVRSELAVSSSELSLSTPTKLVPSGANPPDEVDSEESNQQDHPGTGIQAKQCDHKGSGPSVMAERLSDDGYNWRKYGQKHVKGSVFPRSYYKCRHPNCEVKRRIKRSPDGHMAEIVYKGRHDHPKPEPNQRVTRGIMMHIQGERSANVSPLTGETSSDISYETSDVFEPNSTAKLSLAAGNEDGVEGAASLQYMIRDEVDGDDPFSKRRRMDIGGLDVTPMIKPIREPRVVVQTLGEVDILDDGYRWRKYGQKVARGDPNPRSYYKCTNAGCPVRKHVERASNDKKAVVTTYEGKHNHDVPTARASSLDVAALTAPARTSRVGTEEGETISLDLGVGISSAAEARSSEPQGSRHATHKQLVQNQIHLNNSNMKVATTGEKRQVASVEKFVGTDVQVNHILSLMNIDDKDNRIVVVIHGEGGIGKTTLAKLVYDQVSGDFDCCSFVADIKETTQVLGGLQLLQTKLISDVLKRELEDVAFVNRGIELFRDSICNMRVLITLDDVESAFHVQKLIGDCFDCFASGSRILVTTRNSVVLEESPQIRTYHVSRLDNDQALQLLRQHASIPTSSSHSNLKLLEDALDAMAGLPLSIEVTGAIFNSTAQEEWNSLLSWGWPTYRHRDFQRILEKGYHRLDNKQKQIFLDIACFTNSIDLRIAWYLWDDFSFPPSREILTPLAKVGEKNQIWMHSMLRRFGREIVRRESLADPGRQSRLFNPEIALDTTKRRKGTEEVEALCLNFQWHTSVKLTPEDFESMPNLRLLQLDHADIAGDFANLFPNLRWLRWRGCPRHLQVTNFHLGNLTILDLSWSKVTKDWEGWEQIEMQNLRVLDLTGCAELLVTPKFSGCKNLAILILERCSQLVKIDHSIGDLQHLVTLNLKFCTELGVLPVEVGHLTALKELLMDGTSVQEIPISVGHLKQLETLSASNCCSLRQLPRTICHLTNMSLLSLGGTRITALPDSIGELVRLRHLSLRDSRRIRKLPNSIGNIGRSLVELDVSGTGVFKFPDSMKDLQNLKVLRMDSCFFGEFPPDIGELTSLEEIHASWCRTLEGGIPSEIGKLHNLRILRLRHSTISSIPAEIHQLSNLRILDLLHCDMIKELPRLPSSITILYVDDELKSLHLP